MKNVLIFLGVAVMGLIAVCCFGFSEEDNSYLRIHIRANSNLDVDQNIKYQIKDEVINYLTPIVASATDLNDMVFKLEQNLNYIDDVCNNVLAKSGFNYYANSKINNEFFPTRVYGEYILEQDFYDALIIELGSAEGDNWWCVVYPPLCFVDNSSITNVVYKSKIYEIIENFFD